MFEHCNFFLLLFYLKMEMGEEVFLHDHREILYIMDFALPQRIFYKANYFKEMDDFSLTRFRLTK